MTESKQFEVIIIGGSYSGLSAAMALGRALRNVLVIDSGLPCNRQTPYSHNFITQDGKTPAEIAALARMQVEKYSTIEFLNGIAAKGTRTEKGFQIQTEAGEVFAAKKIIFATGIRDLLPGIPGIAECWGITVIHCPYCHGYEVRQKRTGILGNGDFGFEFSALISNWTNDLTLYTNGKSTLTGDQTAKLQNHGINIAEDEIEYLVHENGHLQQIFFKNKKGVSIEALYARPAFVQHSDIPQSLGCAMDNDGYMQVDQFQKTNIHGVFACGDNTTRMRTVANSVAMGTTAGIMVNKELIEEYF